MNLREFAKENSVQLPALEYEKLEAAAAAEEKRRQDILQKETETAEGTALKNKIMIHLERGEELHIILYHALNAVGLLSHDTNWSTAAKAHLDAIFEDLEQQSFIADNKAIAADRISKTAEEYNKKLKKNINTQLYRYQKIVQELGDLSKDIETENA